MILVDACSCSIRYEGLSGASPGFWQESRLNNEEIIVHWVPWLGSLAIIAFVWSNSEQLNHYQNNLIFVIAGSFSISTLIHGQSQYAILFGLFNRSDPRIIPRLSTMCQLAALGRYLPVIFLYLLLSFRHLIPSPDIFIGLANGAPVLIRRPKKQGEFGEFLSGKKTHTKGRASEPVGLGSFPPSPRKKAQTKIFLLIGEMLEKYFTATEKSMNEMNHKLKSNH